MEFLDTDSPEDKQLKLRMLEIYNKWVAVGIYRPLVRFP